MAYVSAVNNQCNHKSQYNNGVIMALWKARPLIQCQVAYGINGVAYNENNQCNVSGNESNNNVINNGVMASSIMSA